MFRPRVAALRQTQDGNPGLRCSTASRFGRCHWLDSTELAEVRQCFDERPYQPNAKYGPYRLALRRSTQTQHPEACPLPACPSRGSLPRRMVQFRYERTNRRDI